MSPRGFKLGLAVFVMMSGLFVAKLAAAGSGSIGAWWSGLSFSLPTGAKAPPDHTAPAPVVTTPVASVKTAETAAALEAESAAHSAPPLSESDKALVNAIRTELKARGYDVGPEQQTLTLHSRAAIIAFEADNDLRLTGEASEPLLHRLLLGAANNQANGSSPPAPRAEDVIRSVQAALAKSGHPDLKVDGRMSSETVDTIRAFERSNDMKVTGRISGELVARLKPVARDAAAARH